MTDSATPVGTIQVAPRRAWIAFAVVLVGAAMSLIDATIVNVALPSIRTSINASEATLSWIISGYALAFGLALIPAGRIGDRHRAQVGLLLRARAVHGGQRRLRARRSPTAS